MTELEKIEYTKTFIDKLANGINPIDDTPVPETDLINNIRISRCLFYVSDILGQIIYNNGIARKSRASKMAFYLTAEQASRFEFSQEPIGIKEIVSRLNALIPYDDMKKLKTTAITEWLVDIDLLYSELLADGRRRKRPTPRGNSFGITESTFEGQYGEYHKVLYDEKAQHFIIDNIEAVAERNKL